MLIIPLQLCVISGPCPVVMLLSAIENSGAEVLLSFQHDGSNCLRSNPLLRQWFPRATVTTHNIYIEYVNKNKNKTKQINKKKGSSVGENALLVRDIRGECPVWFELTERLW